LFRIVTGDKSGVFVKRKIAFSAQTIEYDQQASMFFIETGLYKIDDRDAMSGLAPHAKSMTEHKPQRCLKHCLIGLLEAGFFVESKNLASRRQFLVGACKEALNLRPIDRVWL
jgi:hypothetical protein